MVEPKNDVISTATEETGWDRLKRLYSGKDFLLERDICLKMAKTSFLCGFCVGGMNTRKESEQRFDTYAEGKKFSNRRDAFVCF
jgi:hypothetical protein